MELRNQGGRLEAKVTSVNEAAGEFTVKIMNGHGHEHHDKTFVLPVSMWNGPGAVLGEQGGPVYRGDDPRKSPRPNDSVIFDADIYAAAQKKAAEAAEAAKAEAAEAAEAAKAAKAAKSTE